MLPVLSWEGCVDENSNSASLEWNWNLIIYHKEKLLFIKFSRIQFGKKGRRDLNYIFRQAYIMHVYVVIYSFYMYNNYSKSTSSFCHKKCTQLGVPICWKKTTHLFYYRSWLLYVLILLKRLHYNATKAMYVSFTYYIWSISTEKTEKKKLISSQKNFWPLGIISHSLPQLLVVYNFLRIKSENKTSPEISESESCKWFYEPPTLILRNCCYTAPPQSYNNFFLSFCGRKKMRTIKIAFFHLKNTTKYYEIFTIKDIST